MIEFNTSPDDYARVAQEQREWARRMADKIERGEPLDRGLDRKVAAAILRGFADNLPDTAPRKAGQAPKIDAGEVALQYAALRGRGAKKGQAIAELAERWGVSDEAIRKSLKKNGDEAMRLLGVEPNQKN